MRGLNFLSVLIILFAVSANGTVRTTKERLIANKPVVKVIGDERPVMIRIPPPVCYTNKSANLSGEAKFVVQYNGFSLQAKAAFQKAVDIWASMIKSPVTIRIEANWKALEKSTLGSCGSTNYYKGYDGMPLSETYYPISLAEKLTGENINGSTEYEMIAEFNKASEWYLGLDGNTPADKYDLVSVVLHEICHGLGFTGSFSVENDLGSWGWGDDTPFVYDRYIFDSKNVSLLNEEVYQNNSVELKQALTSQSIYFDGPLLKAEFGKSVSLYAPSIWDDGSSVSHINNSYSWGNESLMTFSLNKGKSVHDPGVLALSILDELGWKNMRIIHEPVLNSEDIRNIQISAKIVPDFPTSVFKPTLHYSKDSSKYIEVGLTKGISDTTQFSATIPISSNADVNYYLTAGDKYGRLFKIPVTSPEINYSFFIGTDTIPPEIEHYPNIFLMPGQNSIVYNATVTDAFGVDTVWLEYSFNGVKKSNLPFKRMKDSKFNLILDIALFDVQVGDSINYRIMARDKSKAKNLRSYPDEGTIGMRVEAIPDLVESLENDFEIINNDFILQGFEIIKPDGFLNNALHSIHPYEFAGEGSHLEYIAQIRFPVKVDKTYHYLSFDEIVLVEPGEDGAVFGSEDFYDYVVVEASKDDGKTWLHLEPGWDCRYNQEWNSAYNKSISVQFSKAVGNPSMFKNHLINITRSGVFKIGDEILIRFRLYSDPYANGWGWAIDNLKIQKVGVSNQQLTVASNFKVYPNPVTGNELTIDTKGDKITEVILYNFQGSIVFKTKAIGNKNLITLPEGIKGGYILYVNTEKRSDHFKIIVE